MAFRHSPFFVRLSADAIFLSKKAMKEESFVTKKEDWGTLACQARTEIHMSKLYRVKALSFVIDNCLLLILLCIRQHT